MTKLGTAILLIASAAISLAGCDSNPTPHPIHGEPDATGPNIGGGDVLGTELGRDPEPGEQDPDDDSDCPCATPDNEYGGEDDTDSGRGDDNETDPCDDDNGTATANPDGDGDVPAPPGTVRKKLP